MPAIPLTLPEPPTLISDASPLALLVLFGSTALAAAGLAIYWAVVRRDWLPLACCAGALVCSLNEPIFDILGKIVYAQNSYMAYSAFGRDIPWFLVVGYIAWVGLFPYVIAGWMQDGWPASRLYATAILGVLSVVLIEAVNHAFFGGWKYYGEAPLKYFGGVAAMASVPLAAGFLIYAFAFPAVGWRRVLAGFTIPLFSLPMMFAATGWPLYIALYSDLPAWANYAAVALMLLLIALAVVATVRIAQLWREHVEPNLSADRESAPPTPDLVGAHAR